MNSLVLHIDNFAKADLLVFKGKNSIIINKKNVVSQEYVVNEIKVKNKTYKLIKPLNLDVNNEKDVYFIKEKYTNICASGKTFKEALKDFFNEFDFIYKTYSQEKDINLTNKAIELKKYLKTIVK